MATTLVIGSKTYSSWSLRPWLFLRHHGVAFVERRILFAEPDYREQIRAVSPTARVPLLIDGDVKVWESLAICEYVAERDALAEAWPSTRAARALARSAACEMHAGFGALRSELVFDVQRPPSPKPLSAAAANDVSRIRQIWRDARLQHGSRGDWLFGRFGIVDAMFAPVALRFHHYGVALDGWEADYVQAVRTHSAVREWCSDAATEPKNPGH